MGLGSLSIPPPHTHTPPAPPAALSAPKSDQRRFRCGPVQRSSDGVRCPTAAGRPRGGVEEGVGWGGESGRPRGGRGGHGGSEPLIKILPQGGDESRAASILFLRAQTRGHGDGRPPYIPPSTSPPPPPLHPYFPLLFSGEGHFSLWFFRPGGSQSPFLLKVGVTEAAPLLGVWSNERRLLRGGRPKVSPAPPTPHSPPSVRPPPRVRLHLPGPPGPIAAAAGGVPPGPG